MSQDWMAFHRKYYSQEEALNGDNELLLSSDGTFHDIHRPEKSCIRQRYMVAVACFFGFAIAYAARINLSVALVAMVNGTYIEEQNTNNHTTVDTCPNLEPQNTSKRYNEGEFKWTPYTQGVVSSSFYYGYITTQIIGGLLADKYGAKHVLGFGILVSTTISLLSPVAARLHLYAFVALRVVEGMFQAVLYPAGVSLIAAWAPINERAIMNSPLNFGVFFGIIVAFPASGILCDEGFSGGWPSAFYVFGALGLLWYPAWLYLISNTPQSHPRISRQELDYIQESLPTLKHVKPPVPWLKILTSIHVWALIICALGSAFGYGAILAFLPMYMKEVLKFSMISGGVVSVIPYITSAVASILAGYLADYLAVKLHSVAMSRRIMTVFSSLVCGALLASIPAAGCSRVGVISLLATSTFFNTFQGGGCFLSPIDLAPQYAGSLMGITNTAGSLGMILGPLVTGALTNNAQTLGAWGNAFYVMASATIVSGLFFIVFASGTVQPWAMTKQQINVNEESINADPLSDSQRTDTLSDIKHLK